MFGIAALLVAVPLVAPAQEAGPEPQQDAPPRAESPPSPIPAQPAAPPAEPEQPPNPAARSETEYAQHPRNRRYFGFALGRRRGVVDDADLFKSFNYFFGPSTTELASYAARLEAGLTFSPRTLGGVEWNIAVATDSATPGTVVLQNMVGVLTHFPAKEGFFLRAGVGLAVYSYRHVRVRGGERVVSGADLGGDVSIGIGYAFRLGRSLNLTLQADLSEQRYVGASDGPLTPKSSRNTAAYLGCAWY